MQRKRSRGGGASDHVPGETVDVEELIKAPVSPFFDCYMQVKKECMSTEGKMTKCTEYAVDMCVPKLSENEDFKHNKHIGFDFKIEGESKLIHRWLIIVIHFFLFLEDLNYDWMGHIKNGKYVKPDEPINGAPPNYDYP